VPVVRRKNQVVGYHKLLTKIMRGDAMLRSLAIYIGITVAALVLSISDFAWPSEWIEECSETIKISDIMESPMGRTIVQISVDSTIPGTDSDCANFAWCVRKLFDLYPNVLRVEIMNPEYEWVPSVWRSIDLCHARLLNEAWEEYGEYQDADDFLEACYEVQYPDKLDPYWRD
jgi:hypothetical protein